MSYFDSAYFASSYFESAASVSPTGGHPTPYVTNRPSVRDVYSVRATSTVAAIAAAHQDDEDAIARLLLGEI